MHVEPKSSFSDLATGARITRTSAFMVTGLAKAPSLNTNVSSVAGVICGYRIEEFEDPIMRQVRYLDKLVDELAKGRAMEKILRK